MNIHDVVNSTDPKIAEIGGKAVQLTNALKEGIITKTEYEELVEDLVDVERIEKLANTVEQKAALYNTLTVIKAFLLVALKG